MFLSNFSYNASLTVSFLFIKPLFNQDRLSEIKNLFHRCILAKIDSNTINFITELKNKN